MFGAHSQRKGTVRSSARHTATTTDWAKMTPGLLRQTLSYHRLKI